MSTDTSVECRLICRPRCRPIYRLRGAQNTNDAIILYITLFANTLSSPQCYMYIMYHAEPKNDTLTKVLKTINGNLTDTNLTVHEDHFKFIIVESHFAILFISGPYTRSNSCCDFGVSVF